MDQVTHVIVARALLEGAGLSTAAAPFSMLPAIDSKPRHFHRLYFHSLWKIPQLVRSAVPLNSNKWECSNSDDYGISRMVEEREYFSSMIAEAMAITGDNTLCLGEPSFTDAFLSTLSHLWLDLFNNPVQAFVPLSCLASGHWKFWESIDIDKFRERFYRPDNLRAFHVNLYEQLAAIETRIAPEAATMVLVDELFRSLAIPSHSSDLVSKEKLVVPVLNYFAEETRLPLLSVAGSDVEKARVWLRDFNDIIAGCISSSLQ